MITTWYNKSTFRSFTDFLWCSLHLFLHLSASFWKNCGVQVLMNWSAIDIVPALPKVNSFPNCCLFAIVCKEIVGDVYYPDAYVAFMLCFNSHEIDFNSLRIETYYSINDTGHIIHDKQFERNWRMSTLKVLFCTVMYWYGYRSSHE